MPFGSIKSNELPSVDDGDYSAGFEDFFPLDKDSIPQLATQAGRLVIRYHAKVAGGSEDGNLIPGTVNADTPSLATLVSTFGGNPDVITLNADDPDTVGQTLIQVQNELKEIGKKVTLTVKNKWIKEKSHVPDGLYYVRFYAFTSNHSSGRVGWMTIPSNKKDFGPQNKVFGQLLITQMPNMTNVLVPFSIVYPFKLSDEGQVSWVFTKTGDKNTSSKVWENFMKVFGADPEFFPVDEVQDKTNITPEVLEALVRADRLAFVAVKNGYADLKQLNNPPATITSSLSPVEEAKTVLFAVIEREVNNADSTQHAFAGNGKITAEGKQWCAEKMKPICAEEGISTKFDDMTVRNVRTILERLGFNADADKIPVPANDDF